MNSSPQNKYIIPVNFPWTDKDHKRMPFVKWFKSRLFSISFLIAIWSVVWVLGYGSTLDCESSEQLAFICGQAVWTSKILTAPFEYFISLFTSPFFHNGLEHTLYVTILGFVIIIQSFEANYGTKATVTMFFLLIALATTTWVIIANVAQVFWPDGGQVVYAFSRNWMGASVGFFGMYGALLNKSRMPLLGILIMATFEILTSIVLGIRLPINLTHITSVIYGFLIWGAWLRYQQKNNSQTMTPVAEI